VPGKTPSETPNKYEFNASYALRLIEAKQIKHTLEYCLIHQQLITQIEHHAGVEQKHLSTLKDSDLAKPVIVIIWPDGDGTVIDGNHRLLARARRGDKDFPAYIIPAPHWEKILIDIRQIVLRQDTIWPLSRFSTGK